MTWTLARWTEKLCKTLLTLSIFSLTTLVGLEKLFESVQNEFYKDTNFNPDLYFVKIL